MAQTDNPLAGANLLDVGLDALTAPDEGGDEAERRRIEQEAQVQAQLNALGARVEQEDQQAEPEL